MLCHFNGRRTLICAMLLVWAAAAHAADARLEVLSVDLASGIDRATAFPSRFAVDVPHAASPATHGQWTTAGTTSTWRYSVQIPGAVSMSFHAAGARLPAS